MFIQHSVVSPEVSADTTVVLPAWLAADMAVAEVVLVRCFSTGWHSGDWIGVTALTHCEKNFTDRST